MPRRSRRELDSNRVARQAHPILGAIFGVLIGASLGLGTCIWVIPCHTALPRRHDAYRGDHLCLRRLPVR